MINAKPMLHEPDEFEKLKSVLDEIGVRNSEETVTDFYVDWYGYPKEWLRLPCIRAADAQFVFSFDGKFVGVGIGDEQTSCDFREQQQEIGHEKRNW